MRDPAEMERAVVAFAGSANGGLIVTVCRCPRPRRDLIISLAARHKLPAVYLFDRVFVTTGGLISYGPDFRDQGRVAAVTSVAFLEARNPSDLPMQAPTKFELAINLKTAKALGLEVSPALLARADEVIE